jgi:hypothetical protein
MRKKTALGKSTAIGYRGDVKLSTYQGKYLLSSKTYRNEGALPLFRFLADCLAGNFPAAYKNRPYKIRLLKVMGEDPDNIVMPQALRENTSVDKHCSDFIMMTTAPEVIVSETSEGQSCKVSFSFTFPSSYVIYSGANVVALYGPGVNNSAEYSAYYKLTKQVADGDTIKNVWDPIVRDFEDDEANKIFAIEWTLTLSNQK